MTREILLVLSAAVLFCLPGFIWYERTGDLSFYFSNSAPEGQWFYVLSKLAGMYTLMSIAWQIIVMLLTRLGLLQLRRLSVMHGVFGSLIVVLAMSHAILFFIAMSQRQGEPAWALLVPDFSNYYHTYLTLGLLGLFILLAVCITGILCLRKPFSFAKKLHNLYWLSLGFTYIHALSIGTESQTSAGLVLYLALGGLAIFLWILLMIKQFKTSVIFE